MRRWWSLVKDLGRLIRRRKVWFLVPVICVLIFAMLLLVVMQSPALIPFFYTIF